jgi:hypothetical protein
MLTEILSGVGYIIALLAILVATVAFSRYLANACVEKLAEAERSRIQDKRQSDARQRKKVAEQQEVSL